MTHLSEDCRRLIVQETAVHELDVLRRAVAASPDVTLLRLPAHDRNTTLSDISELAAILRSSLPQSATLIIVGEVLDLVHIHTEVVSSLQYHLWIAIKRHTLRIDAQATALPEHHFGALVYTHLGSPLAHTKTRIEYTYCPTCNKTTKDYGGKKHTYHEYGTLVSDVWRDIACDPEGDITPIVERFADLFGIERYHHLHVLDLQTFESQPNQVSFHEFDTSINSFPPAKENTVILGDCLQELRQLPDNSIDFAFADPPYNLGKDYTGYSDDLAIAEYFDWCDEWISKLARVLKPGRTCALLNIPLWAIRHFLHMETVLQFQNWIAWDALSFPVRLIMPAHYTILCFTKGTPRPLPGLTGQSGMTEPPFVPRTFRSLSPLAEGYCLRQKCVQNRLRLQVNDRGPLTDLWWDIHRVKHNSRRVDHPCQLPPQLMYRLISLFTMPGETVLDCFNGAGTSTLAAHQIGRSYLGIEATPKYRDLAHRRHIEITRGIDPFRKQESVLTEKNSPVARLPKQKYAISKKTLQLEVKRIAQALGHIPDRAEVIAHGKYPIRYYDTYFSSWGEVCAAARTTGMSESREVGAEETRGERAYQPHLFILEE
ncbi:MAG: site-specific DNA-methyltransferase [Anaerolineae bacterium]|nr:site-specific DNA-methyltransferase [Anaerolineae bacterium]